MNEKTLSKATEIKNQIDVLRNEIKEFPRYILNREIYEKSNKKYGYISRNLERVKKRRFCFVLRVHKGYQSNDLIFELSDEDLQALVDIRQRKIETLLNELEKL